MTKHKPFVRFWTRLYWTGLYGKGKTMESISVQIAGRRIGDPGNPSQSPPVVAEIGINHNGSVALAQQLITKAADIGCWGVKLQTRTVPVVYSAAELAKPREVDREMLVRAVRRGVLSQEAVARLETSNYAASTNGDQKLALEFTDDELLELSATAREHNIVFFSSPWDEASVDRLERILNPPCYKVASASLTDRGLLERIRSTGKPVILSTGMSTLEEVRKAVKLFEGTPLVLLHAVSVYPCKDEELNLRGIETLKREFPHAPVGYSGHEHGTSLCVMAAVKYNLCMIERHFTVDRAMYGSDQAASLEPEGMRRVVDNLNRFWRAQGTGEKTVSLGEQAVKAKLRRVDTL